MASCGGSWRIRYTDFGDPILVEQYNNYYIYVYDYNIAPNNFEGKFSVTARLTALEERLSELGTQYNTPNLYYYDPDEDVFSQIGDEFYPYSDSGDILAVMGSLDDDVNKDIIEDNFTLIEQYNDEYIFYSEKNVVDLSTGLPVGGDNISVDYLYTAKVVNKCNYQDGKWLTSGENGFSFFGPYAPTYTGKYRFTLYYDYVDDKTSSDNKDIFDIVINSGKEQLGTSWLDPQQDYAEIEVSFEDGSKFEYRLRVYSGSIIEIKCIKMEKIA